MSELWTEQIAATGWSIKADATGRVIEAHALRSSIQDGDLLILRQWPHLVELWLANTKITDRGLDLGVRVHHDRTGLGYVQSDAQVQYQAINEKFIINMEGGQTVQVSRQTLPSGQVAT